MKYYTNRTYKDCFTVEVDKVIKDTEKKPIIKNDGFDLKQKFLTFFNIFKKS
jgi:hypothetical protein